MIVQFCCTRKNSISMENIILGIELYQEQCMVTMQLRRDEHYQIHDISPIIYCCIMAVHACSLYTVGVLYAELALPRRQRKRHHYNEMYYNYRRFF